MSSPPHPEFPNDQEAKPGRYTERFYRRWQNPRDLLQARVCFRETDLHLFHQPPGAPSQEDITAAARSVLHDCYRQLDAAIRGLPGFQAALCPLPLPAWIQGGGYPLIEDMAAACSLAGVGPMAAVAGAVAERVGRELLERTPQVIVENGGDLFIASRRERIMLVYAGEDSPFRDRIRVRLPAAAGLGVCTSSGRVGHSMSFGRADAALVMARSAAVADACATALGNLVSREDDLEAAVDFARSWKRILGGLVIIGRRIALWGELELV